MFRSNLLFNLLLIMTTIVVTGCWKPAQKDDPHNGKSERDATASFNVTKIDCEAVTPRVAEKVWKVTDHKEIFARACVIDRKASKEIKGHKFTVEFPETNTRQTDLVTDESGCFQWQEKLAYNPLAEQAGYVEIRRRIYGEGVHVGFRDVRLEINPWAGERGSDKQNACKYMKTGQVSTSQKLDPADTKLALQGKAGKSKLWMSDIAVQPTLTNERDDSLRAERNLYDNRKEVPGQIKRKAFADESGALLEVLLSMKPQVLVKGLDGDETTIDLKSGQFNIWVQLIAANVGDNRDKTLLLTPNLIPADGKIIAGKLEAAVRMGLSRRVTRGRLEMAIKVVPVGLSVPVEPFESLYVLGDIENIIGGFKPMLSPKTYEGAEKFNYDQYVTAAENFDELKKTQQALKFEPFIFETATMMFAGIRPGETATKRTIEYKIQTCVRDTLTGRRVQHQKFQVFDEETGKEILAKQPDGTLAALATNQEGCLIWTSSLTHKYYLPEEFFFPKFKIVHPGSSNSKIKELVMNPWDAMFRTFGFDRIEFTQEFIDSVKNRKKIPSRMFIPRYSYHAIRFRYEIDRFMELEVKKQILLNLRPDVLRYSGIIGGRKVTESLRDGIYLMKVAIQKDYLDPTDKGYFLMPGRDSQGKETTSQKRSGNKPMPKHFVTVVKKLVRVNSGEINTPVEFAVQDLRMMRIRSQFMVQLEPVDEQLLLVAKVLAAQDRKKIEDLDKSRAMSDDMRRHIITEKRERLESNLVKIRAKLANLKTGMLDVDRLTDMSDAELEQFDLTKELTKDVIEDLKLNDFTVLDTAPVVELDSLVEKDSGLDRRTFIGPMIFLSNAYGDDLRPTDNLDERRCDVSDCDEIKTREVEGRKFRNNYDTSKYFGSVAHLADKQVDDLINEYKSERAQYKKMMPAISSVANFASIYNLAFVTMGNEKLMKTDWACSGSVEQCSKPASDVQIDAEQLIHAMNANDGEYARLGQMRDVILEPTIRRNDFEKTGVYRPVRIEDFQNAARGLSLSRALGDRLCRMYAINLSKAVMSGFVERTQRDVYNYCLNAVVRSKADGQGMPFTMDTKLRVFETGEYVYKGGKQMNLNVGSSFSLNHNYSFGVSYGAGIDLIDFPFIGGLGQWTKPFSLKLSAGGGANRSKSDGTSISESTYLVMQAASFAIQLKEYERCTVVKLNTRVIGQMLRYYVRDNDGEAKLYAAAQRGLFVCTGERETKPLPVTESYFYFTQHFTEGDMLDQADLYNHPWLLAMRGVRDFSTFAYLIRAQEFSLYAPFKPVVDKPGWPLDQMVEAYRQVLPTFPGLYTVLRKGEALQEFPFDQDAEVSFK